MSAKIAEGWFRECQHVAAHYFRESSALCGAGGIAPVKERRGFLVPHWKPCRRCLSLVARERGAI